MTSDRLDTIMGEIRRGLEDRKRSIAAQMRGYPQPIAGCDAQYQHLSDERAAIARALAAFGPESAADPDAVGAFVETTRVLDGAARARLLAALAREEA